MLCSPHVISVPPENSSACGVQSASSGCLCCWGLFGVVHCRAWQRCALELVGPFQVQLFLSHSSELPLPTLVLLCFFRLTLSPFPFFLSISSTAPEQPGVSWAFLSSPEQLSFALDVCLQLWNRVTAVRGNIRGKNCLVLPSPVLENPSVPHCWLLWLVLTWELCITHDLDESEVLFSSTYLHSACTFDSSYSSQAVRSGMLRHRKRVISLPV